MEMQSSIGGFGVQLGRVLAAGAAWGSMLFAATNIVAQEGPQLTFRVENDSFLVTDRHYTHGTRLAYAFRPKAIDENSR